MIDDHLRAIIDIGSNSVRLVVYAGSRRAPEILFNEKVMAGLGQGLGNGGPLDVAARAAAMRALQRFQALAQAMGVAEMRCVATAALRDASDGTAFVAEAATHGLAIDLLSGAAEGEASGFGVISAMPQANGIVGDLGGGSLELVRVAGGEVHERVSLPLGVLRLAEIRVGKKRQALENHVARLIRKSGFVAPRGLPFYLVGGSWRTLGRLHMALTHWPLAVLHQYVMPADAAQRLVHALARMDRKRLKSIEGVSAARAPALGDAAALLSVLVRQLGSSELVVSAAGLREGLLYQQLDAATRARDPLLVETRAAGKRLGRFAEHGALINDWIAPLFGSEDGDARLRAAACLLGDVAWAANPEYRCERGLETAIHGSWTAIDARGRAMLGQALYTSFGGNGTPGVVAALLAPEDAARAARWGLAMRLGQRLSGGVESPLRHSRLSLDEGVVRLAIDDRALYGEAVERRHRALATALGRRAEVA